MVRVFVMALQLTPRRIGEGDLKIIQQSQSYVAFANTKLCDVIGGSADNSRSAKKESFCSIQVLTK